ncbi:hypothetical protein PsYK624_063560 [Phanerochaete sordida]|uniref:Uncharacterized protein n=1 Tax=Phanerochaete sordida TaxID=48140 RepID=A0A9P3G6L4_9APHY|nr:hypothetical protein PsYK624_063560 [Phanerochaete sordida]
MSNVRIGWQTERPPTKLLCRDQFELRWGKDISASTVATVVAQLHDNTALRLTDSQRVALYDLQGYILGRTPADGLGPLFPGRAGQVPEPSDPAPHELWPDIISVALLDFGVGAPPPDTRAWRVYSKDHTTLVRKKYSREPGGTHVWVDTHRAVRYCPHVVRTSNKVFPGDVLDQANLVLDYLSAGVHTSKVGGCSDLGVCGAVLEHVRTVAWAALLEGTKAGDPKV